MSQADEAHGIAARRKAGYNEKEGYSLKDGERRFGREPWQQERIRMIARCRARCNRNEAARRETPEARLQTYQSSRSVTLRKRNRLRPTRQPRDRQDSGRRKPMRDPMNALNRGQGRTQCRALQVAERPQLELTVAVADTR